MHNGEERWALFISWHNWKTKRQGGFHHFATAFCENDYNVGFVSFPRPWYGLILRRERINARVILRLLKGIYYEIAGRKLWNFTCPTLAIPNPIIRNIFHRDISIFDTITFPDLVKRCRNKLSNVNVIIYESCLGVLLFESFRRAFPEAIHVYRPSDPLVAEQKYGKQVREAEEKMLGRADLVLLVNEEGKKLYQNNFPHVHLSESRVMIVPNGVDLAAFYKKYDRPVEYPDKPIALYLGTMNPEWECLFKAAKALPEVCFCIICPESPPRQVLKEIEMYNCVYIPGIKPEKVPQYVTNCDIMTIAYPRDMWKYWPWGLQAKFMQGMAANKVIIGRNMDPNLRKYGIVVADSDEEFICRIQEALRDNITHYNFDLRNRDWQKLKQLFFERIQTKIDQKQLQGSR